MYDDTVHVAPNNPKSVFYCQFMNLRIKGRTQNMIRTGLFQ